MSANEEMDILEDKRIDPMDAGYMELDGAKKDGDCAIVEVEDGISKNLGCCNLFDPEKKAKLFSCGTCEYVRPPKKET